MSRKFRLDKLVRDGIVPSMLEMGQEPTHRTLESEELKAALMAKIIEEAEEGDLPDLLQVIYDYARLSGTSIAELEQARVEKEEKIGGFTTGTYVSILMLDDNDEWVAYYAAEPDRFPEINQPDEA